MVGGVLEDLRDKDCEDSDVQVFVADFRGRYLKFIGVDHYGRGGGLQFIGWDYSNSNDSSEYA